MKQNLVILISFLFCISSVCAQNNNWKIYAPSSPRAVTALVTEGNKVWAGMDKNLHHFNGTQWVEYNKLNSPMGTYPISCIYVSPKGDKYIGTNGNGVYKLSRMGNWSRIDLAKQVSRACYTFFDTQIPTNDVRGITMNDNDELLICHPSGSESLFYKYQISKYVNGQITNADFLHLNSDYISNKSIISLTFINGNLYTKDDNLIGRRNSNTCYNYISGKSVERLRWSNFSDTPNSPFDVYNDKFIYSTYNAINIIPTLFNDTTTVVSYPYSGTPKCEVFYKDDFAVGDAEGLNLKTGFTWKRYNTANSNIPSNNVTHLARDSNGDLWAATDNGIAKFNGTTFTSYLTNRPTNNLPLTSTYGSCYLLMDNAGDLWATRYYNISVKLRLNQCSNIWLEAGPPPLSVATGIVKDNNGHIWVSNSNGDAGDIYRFNGSSWIRYFTGTGEAISCIAKAPNGDIWAAKTRTETNTRQNLYRYNGSTWTTYNSTNSSVAATNIHDIVFTSTGKAWLSTAGGLATFDGTNWVAYTIAGGGRNQAIVDNSDNYWFAKNNMLKRFNGIALLDYPVPSGNIASITKENNDIWVGTDNYKLYKFSISTNTWQQINIGVAGFGVIGTIYVDPQGTKWLSNGNNLLQYNENGIKKGGLSVVASNLSLFAACGTNANSGSVTIQGLHGTLPYSYSWSNNVRTSSLSGLSAGLYKVTITDSTGCSIEQSFPIEQPNKLQIEVSKNGDNPCLGSSVAQVNVHIDSATGTAPFKYFWRNATNDSIGISKTITNLPKGLYKCTVTSNSCVGIDSINVYEPSLALKSVTRVNGTGDFLGLFVYPIGDIGAGAQPTIFGDCSIIWQDGARNFRRFVRGELGTPPLPLGINSYTITNSRGCRHTDSVQVCVTNPTILYNTSSNILKTSANRTTDTIKIKVNGGIAPYKYSWSNGSTDSIQLSLARGTYPYTVTDKNGCTSTGTYVDSVTDSVDVKFRVTFKGSGRRVHPWGVRVTGGLGASSQLDWNPAAAKVMVLQSPTWDSVYTINIKIPRRAPNEIYEYKFVNGNDWGTGANGTPEDERGVPAPCRRDVNDNRFFILVPFPATSMTLPCYRFNTCTVFPTTGTSDLTSIEYLTIYPNPTTGQFILELADNITLNNAKVTIFNLIGQTVNQQNFSGQKVLLDLSNHPQGTYFVKLKIENGLEVTQKIQRL